MDRLVLLAKLAICIAQLRAGNPAACLPLLVDLARELELQGRGDELIDQLDDEAALYVWDDPRERCW